MPFRTFSEEEVLTAALVNRYWIQQAHVIKTADETVTNSSTVQNDDQLFVPLLANSAYWFECMLIYDGIQAADIKIGFAFPAGASLVWTHGGLDIGSTGLNGEVSRAGRSAATGDAGCPNGSTGGTRVYMPVEGRVATSGTAGNLQLQWSQNTANATGTIMGVDSVMIVQRLTV
jgi:hypothetical protein